MDGVANLPGIKPIELVQVQHLHLFLGVTTKEANISTTSNGIAICERALNASEENPRKLVFRFP
jgi:hypothetical protein